MSKSDIPFWKVAQNFQQEMIYPHEEEFGQMGVSYNYCCAEVCFPTWKKFPPASVNLLLFRKKPFIAYLSSFLFSL